MDLELPEELRLMQASVRKFVDETLAPHEKEVEEKDEGEEGERGKKSFHVRAPTQNACRPASVNRTVRPCAAR